MLAGFVLLLTASVPRDADALIYWTGYSSETNSSVIGRAEMDGRSADESWTPTGDWGKVGVWGLAVDQAHLYWVNYTRGGGAVGRARVDGTNVNKAFLPRVFEDGLGITADSAYIYYSDGGIVRFTLDGHPASISSLDPWIDQQLAVDSAHIYWISNSDPHAIGRANLDGSNADSSFIELSGDDSPTHALAVAGGHIYWDSQSGIGRADVDGSNVDPAFITGINDDHSVHGGIAVDDEHVYWTNYWTAGGTPDVRNSIGRADITGGNVEPGFIKTEPGLGRVGSWGIAVDSRLDGTPPKTKLLKGAPDRIRRDTATFKFSASEPGSSFRCRLDERDWRGCSSPKEVKNLKSGKHEFRVRAIDTAGNRDPSPAKDRFEVVN